MPKLVFLSVICLALPGVAITELPEPVFSRPRITPMPRELTFESRTPVRLNDVTFEIICPDSVALDWVKRHIVKWFGASGNVKQMKSTPKGIVGEEAYRLTADPKTVRIESPGLKGVRWAVMTLRQAARRESGGRRLHGYWLPAMKVTDSPTLRFRGFHFVTVPRSSIIEMERKIRLAAYYKCNYVFFDLGCSFVSERHPEIVVPDAPITKVQARRLAEIGRDLGVTVVPGLQVAGHADTSFGGGGFEGKHFYLDLHPDLQPLFDNNKSFNWCLTNPDARAMCRELVAEIHEAFLNPPYFHINCDELSHPDCPTCIAMKDRYHEVVRDHVTELAATLRKRKARALMWHDMLLDRKNPAWKPCFYANGNAAYEKMATELPKDIVICDWYYGAPHGKNGKSDPGAYPTIDHFKSLGFDVLTCTFDDVPSFMPQANYARKAGILGLLETTWYARGQNLQMKLVAAANAAWSEKATPVNYHDATYYWRQMGWDSGVSDYADTGFTVMPR
jgi:hypothetical protein